MSTARDARALIDAARIMRKANDLLADSVRDQARTEVTAAFADIRRAPEAPPPPSPAARGKAAFDAIIADLDL